MIVPLFVIEGGDTAIWATIEAVPDVVTDTSLVTASPASNPRYDAPDGSETFPVNEICAATDVLDVKSRSTRRV